jgi:hypothetical protein
MYEVTVEQAGFQKATVAGVAVEVTAERRLDVAFNGGGAEADVTVAANAQVVTTSSTLGGTIQARQVEELPVNGRDFTKFLVLAPGMTGDPSVRHGVFYGSSGVSCRPEARG